MIRNLLAFVAALSFTACDFKSPTAQENQDQPQEQQVHISKADLEQLDAPLDTVVYTEPNTYVDSFRIEMDSLMRAKIELPPIYQHEILEANEDAATKFDELAKSSKGTMKILVNSSVVAAEVERTISKISASQSDLLILIDKTGSMQDDIDNIKASLTQIIERLKRYKGTRLAIAFFGDKNCDGMGWYSFKNFETYYDAAQQYIDDMKVNGGGDWPESVYDAVFKSFEQDFWQSTTKRNIILIGDAPPLEKPLSDYTLNDVLQKAKEGAVVMNFYPIIIMPEISKVRIERSELAKYESIKLATSLYPNPSQGSFTVGLQECATYHMEIYNAAGAAVASEDFYGLSWTKDLGDVLNGMYILRIIGPDHKFELIKFIVQR